MRLKWMLTIACIKMFFREKEAVFWTLFLPLFMVVLFGFVRFDRFGSVELGIVDSSAGKFSDTLSELKAIKTIKVHQSNEADELKALQKGERDLVLMIPENFQPGVALIAFTNDAKVQESQLGTLVLQRVFDEMAF